MSTSWTMPGSTLLMCFLMPGCQSVFRERRVVSLSFKWSRHGMWRFFSHLHTAVDLHHETKVEKCAVFNPTILSCLSHIVLPLFTMSKIFVFFSQALASLVVMHNQNSLAWNRIQDRIISRRMAQMTATVSLLETAVQTLVGVMASFIFWRLFPLDIVAITWKVKSQLFTLKQFAWTILDMIKCAWNPSSPLAWGPPRLWRQSHHW